jgi:quercetin dioxygenase-like cupin family protein
LLNEIFEKMDITKLKNGKYFQGTYDEPNDFNGWFVGSFFDVNHPCKTDKVEIMYKEHQQGDVCKPHYHQEKVELLIMLEGKAKYKVNGKEVLLTNGSYLYADVNNVIEGEFLEKSKIFAIHSPSLPNDKVVM